MGLLIGLLAVKKQGEEQHTTDVSSIADFSNQVADAQLKIIGLNNANLTYSNDFALSQQQAAQLSNSLAAAQVTIAESQTTIANAQQQITNLNSRIGDLEVQNKVLDQQASELTNTIAKLDSLIADTQSRLSLSESNSVYLQQELQKQMEQFNKEFNSNALQFTPQQIEEMQKKLDQFKKDLQSQDPVAPY